MSFFFQVLFLSFSTHKSYSTHSFYYHTTCLKRVMHDYLVSHGKSPWTSALSWDNPSTQWLVFSSGNPLLFLWVTRRFLLTGTLFTDLMLWRYYHISGMLERNHCTETVTFSCNFLNLLHIQVCLNKKQYCTSTKHHEDISCIANFRWWNHHVSRKNDMAPWAVCVQIWTQHEFH